MYLTGMNNDDGFYTNVRKVQTPVMFLIPGGVNLPKNNFSFALVWTPTCGPKAVTYSTQVLSESERTRFDSLDGHVLMSD